MVTRDKRIDAYIEQAADFAKPVLTSIRAIVHAACPDVVETMKWGTPSFDYKGILCGMAAFKAHCTFGFWKHELVVDKDRAAGGAWGSFGRLVSVKELPSKAAMTKMVKQAMRLNDEGVKVARKKPGKRKPLPMPPAMQKALAANAAAKKHFDAFSPSHQREYIEWIREAKGEDTRERRLLQAIEWLSEGKSRNWKYAKC